MLEQQKSKEKQKVGKKNKTPLEGELLPMQAHSAPTKQRIPYHIHASLSSSHPPAWKRKQQKKKKASRAKRQHQAPPPSTKAIAADLAWWRVRQSPRKKHGLRQGIVHYSTASRPALRCQCARRPREPPVAPPGGELPRYFWSIRRA